MMPCLNYGLAVKQEEKYEKLSSVTTYNFTFYRGSISLRLLQIRGNYEKIL
jgi:uncharacterized protein (DUF2252 family)